MPEPCSVCCFDTNSKTFVSPCLRLVSCEQVVRLCVTCYVRIYATLAWMCIWLLNVVWAKVTVIYVSVHYPNVSMFYKSVVSLSCQCNIQRGHSHMSRCVSGDFTAGWNLFIIVCVRLSLGSMCAAVRVCVCTCLRSWEQSMAGLNVPPDITLLSSGPDPAAKVGQLTTPLL